MYRYRKLTTRQRADLVRFRGRHGFPLHSPPHLEDAAGWYLITAATFEHRPYLADDADRAEILRQLFEEFEPQGIECAGWVVLPNHYHVLVHTVDLAKAASALGRVHGRTARALNGRDKTPARKVWYRYSDRLIRSERHYFTTLNYIHHNPVKHGYVEQPRQWPCSSVHWYEEELGREWLRDCWVQYPIRDYGKGWDDAR